MLSSENVEVLPIEEDDWENWDDYLDKFYYMRFQTEGLCSVTMSSLWQEKQDGQ
jgi:hypothetical protein